MSAPASTGQRQASEPIQPSPTLLRLRLSLIPMSWHSTFYTLTVDTLGEVLQPRCVAYLWRYPESFGPSSWVPLGTVLAMFKPTDILKNAARVIQTAFLANVPAAFTPKPKEEFSPKAEKIMQVIRMDWGGTHDRKIRTLMELITGEKLPPITEDEADGPRVSSVKLPVFSCFVIEGPNRTGHSFYEGQTVMHVPYASEYFVNAEGEISRIYYARELRPATMEETDAFLASFNGEMSEDVFGRVVTDLGFLAPAQTQI